VFAHRNCSAVLPQCLKESGLLCILGNVTAGVSVPCEVTVGSRKKTETERNITLTHAGVIQVPLLLI
jgi:hypothetical protein